ncbi:hypothetical protein AOLI_G00303030 [Acnodon oligacanthus]
MNSQPAPSPPASPPAAPENRSLWLETKAQSCSSSLLGKDRATSLRLAGPSSRGTWRENGRLIHWAMKRPVNNCPNSAGRVLGTGKESEAAGRSKAHTLPVLTRRTPAAATGSPRVDEAS